MYCQQRVLKGLSGDYQKKKGLGAFCTVFSKSLTAKGGLKENWKLLSKILPCLTEAHEKSVFEWYILEIVSIAVNKILLATTYR